MASTVRCPKCGGTMHKSAVIGKTDDGKEIVTYVCDNRHNCGATIQKIED